MLREPKLPLISPLHGAMAQGRMEPINITIYQGWGRLTTNDHGELQGSPMEGYYFADTLYVTRYRLFLNGKSLSHRFSAQTSACEWTSIAVETGTVDDGNLPEGTLPKGSIEVRILRSLQEGWTESIRIKNNGEPRRAIELKLDLACPILDAEFEQEMKKDRTSSTRGLRPRARRDEERRIVLEYERSFGRRRHAPTLELRGLHGDNAPREAGKVSRGLRLFIEPDWGSSRCRLKVVPGSVTRIQLSAELLGRAETGLRLRFVPIEDGRVLSAPERVSIEPLPRLASDVAESELQVRSGNPTLDLIIGQAVSDLRTFRLPEELPVADGDPRDYDAIIAGVPRYIGLFGRDTLITGWQAALFDRRPLETGIARLAALRGVQIDPWRDEEPGRLPHERRLNPKSAVGLMNREIYYGDVTGTPFWIIALASLYRWTGDLGKVRRQEHVLRECADWILRKLSQGGGFLYYQAAQPGAKSANRNQAWKDSGDAIVDERGRVRIPPLALCEIQAYCYQALMEAAHLLAELGDASEPLLLRKRAAELRRKFNEKFWVESGGYLAFAIAERGEVIQSRASNMGHCLGTGIIDPEKRRSVVDALLSEDLFSGWGIRTLSSRNPAYDPFSYHRGSVWPVENATIAEGFARCGFRREANDLAAAQLSLAAIFQHLRLPEVLSGHPRSVKHPIPGLYPFANPVQAWSVSAILLHVQNILGIQPLAAAKTLLIDPALPDWLPWIELRNIHVGHALVSLRFWREEDGTSYWEETARQGALTVERGRPLNESGEMLRTA